MKFYPDGEICTELQSHSDRTIVAIGWLAPGNPFTTGTTPLEVYTKLAALCKTSWSIRALLGFADCQICATQPIRSETPQLAVAAPNLQTLGSKFFLIPTNTIGYAFPDLILHYIYKHNYAPPAEFCEAVLRCPPPDSAAFVELMRPFLSEAKLQRCLAAQADK
jgi:hypothetical protein